MNKDVLLLFIILFVLLQKTADQQSSKIASDIKANMSFPSWKKNCTHGHLPILAKCCRPERETDYTDKIFMTITIIIAVKKKWVSSAGA